MKFLREVLIFTCVCCFSLLLNVNCQNSAPSSHIVSNENSKADIISRKAKVVITTPATYYSLINFNMFSGAELMGYTGIQDTVNEVTRYFIKIFPYKVKVRQHLNIFSIWDSKLTNQKIVASYLGEGTRVEPFGGEGEGTKTYNVDFGWGLNHWQTIVLRRWDIPGKTRVGWFVHNEEKGEWRHMATLDYPIAGQYFQSGISAFLEDWLNTGQHVRRYEISESYKRNAETKQWIPLNEMTFIPNKSDRQQGGRSSNYANSYDAGRNGNSFFMQIGGNTRPQSCNFFNEQCTIKVDSPRSPNVNAINFNIVSLSTKEIKWSIPKNQTPQFAYTITKGNMVIAQDINPQARSFTFSPPLNVSDNITLAIEDIYGNVIKKNSSANRRLKLKKKK